MKKILLGFALILMSTHAAANSCNRKDPGAGDYVQPWEFCDDDLNSKTVPMFGQYPVDRAVGLKTRLPTHYEGPDAEDNAAWMEAIRDTFKSGRSAFAGHYMMFGAAAVVAAIALSSSIWRKGKSISQRKLPKFSHP